MVDTSWCSVHLYPMKCDTPEDQASCIAGSQVGVCVSQVRCAGLTVLQYTGPCVPNMSFRKMDKSMKVPLCGTWEITLSANFEPPQQLMEAHCLLSFPCKQTCPIDYSRPWYVFPEFPRKARMEPSTIAPRDGLHFQLTVAAFHQVWEAAHEPPKTRPSGVGRSL